jgi:hypothetical protein
MITVFSSQMAFCRRAGHPFKGIIKITTEERNRELIHPFSAFAWSTQPLLFI